jgi:hypothetical protein
LQLAHLSAHRAMMEPARRGPQLTIEWTLPLPHRIIIRRARLTRDRVWSSNDPVRRAGSTAQIKRA